MDSNNALTLPMTESRTWRAWAALAAVRGRAVWPTLSVGEDQLIRIAKLRVQATGATPDDQLKQLEQLDAAELYLAAACERGDDLALHELYQQYFKPVIPSLRRMGINTDHCADIWQMLCERMLVSHDHTPPRIVRYAGQGKLPGLVRVAATRVALNWMAKDKRSAPGEDWLEQLPALDADPELRSIKLQHGAALKQELEAALVTLSARERMILRLHLIERLGIDAIATLCSVHRSTAARMVARTKRHLSSQLRARLARRWGVVPKDLPELTAMIDSQLDLSLTRLLGT